MIARNHGDSLEGSASLIVQLGHTKIKILVALTANPIAPLAPIMRLVILVN